MRPIQIIFLSVAALICVMFFIRILPQREHVKTSDTKSLSEQTSPNTKINAAPAILGKHYKMAQNTLLEPHIAAHSTRANNDAIDELNRLISPAKQSYQAVLTPFQDALKDYEKISRDFDQMVAQGVPEEELRTLDQIRLENAQELLVLQEKANQAYRKLMTEYDRIIPHIIGKLTSNTSQL